MMVTSKDGYSGADGLVGTSESEDITIVEPLNPWSSSLLSKCPLSSRVPDLVMITGENKGESHGGESSGNSASLPALLRTGEEPITDETETQ